MNNPPPPPRPPRPPRPQRPKKRMPLEEAMKLLEEKKELDRIAQEQEQEKPQRRLICE